MTLTFDLHRLTKPVLWRAVVEDHVRPVIAQFGAVGREPRPLSGLAARVQVVNVSFVMPDQTHRGISEGE